MTQADLFSAPSDPEAELRAIWTAKGVPPERQAQLVADISAKAAPGANVGPFVVPHDLTPPDFLNAQLNLGRAGNWKPGPSIAVEPVPRVNRAARALVDEAVRLASVADQHPRDDAARQAAAAALARAIAGAPEDAAAAEPARKTGPTRAEKDSAALAVLGAVKRGRDTLGKIRAELGDDCAGAVRRAVSMRLIRRSGKRYTV